MIFSVLFQNQSTVLRDEEHVKKVVVNATNSPGVSR